jgi:hypothetical protein
MTRVEPRGTETTKMKIMMRKKKISKRMMMMHL